MITTFFSHIVSELNTFIYPETCLYCKDETLISSLKLCEFCTEELQHLTKLEQKSYLDHYLYPSFTDCFIPYNFTDSIKMIIHTIKYVQGKNLATEFGKNIALHFYNEMTSIPFNGIIACPLHKTKQKEREYNQAYYISLGLANILNIPILTESIQRKRYTKTQTKLSKSEREKNLNKVFSVSLDMNYKHLLIVDDVATTGTTLKEIASEIHQKFPKIKLYAATISTPLLDTE